MWLLLKCQYCFDLCQGEGEQKKNTDSYSHHASIYNFMRLIPWESRGLGRVTMSLGRSKRNRQDNDSESNKVVLKDRQKNFIHPVVQSNGEGMVTSVKESLSERDIKELMINVISCIVCVYNGKARTTSANCSGNQGSTCSPRFRVKDYLHHGNILRTRTRGEIKRINTYYLTTTTERSSAGGRAGNFSNSQGSPEINSFSFKTCEPYSCSLEITKIHKST